ncbi:MAG: biopolymer transporter ExbD [Burkholderiaceae bacterium]|jgi:biopolymer transport protein TolR|nr:biopolymer transporter ExbD [Burkholderiaceae bacterium]
MPAVIHRGRRRAINEINMVPFIDVMLVLLIIFMVTATVITPGVINVPSAGQSSLPPDNYITVSVYAGRQLGSDTGKNTPEQSAASQAELIRHVRQALQPAPDMPVLIAADKDLPYHQVITLMSKLRDEAGARRIALRVK